MTLGCNAARRFQARRESAKDREQFSEDMTMNEQNRKERDASRAAAVDRLGLTYAARFIPQSLSRHAEDGQPTINWRVTISRNGTAIVTDYMQGIAHQPGYLQPLHSRDTGQLRFPGGPSPRAMDAAFRATAESGTYPVRYSDAAEHFTRKPLPVPDLTQVLYSLWTDAQSADGWTFEEWCNDLGFDPDSRTAERDYRTCQDTRTKLTRMLGSEYATLPAIFEDY